MTIGEKSQVLLEVEMEIRKIKALIESLQEELLVLHPWRYHDEYHFQYMNVKNRLDRAYEKYYRLCERRRDIHAIEPNYGKINRKVAHLTVIYEEDLDFEKIVRNGIRGISI